MTLHVFNWHIQDENSKYVIYHIFSISHTLSWKTYTVSVVSFVWLCMSVIDTFCVNHWHIQCHFVWLCMSLIDTFRTKTVYILYLIYLLFYTHCHRRHIPSQLCLLCLTLHVLLWTHQELIQYLSWISHTLSYMCGIQLSCHGKSSIMSSMDTWETATVHVFYFNQIVTCVKNKTLTLWYSLIQGGEDS